MRSQWNDREVDQDRLWSGDPNGASVVEVAGLVPSRALDAGCGESADAVWLAGRGWEVTALEVSGAALDRAARPACDAGVAVRWVHAGLVAALPPGSFDLVCALYPALLRTPEAAADRALLSAVRPGGMLLMVRHARIENQQRHESHQGHDSGFDPAVYVSPARVAALLDDDWQVELVEQRPRVAPGSGTGAHHADNPVLRARRLR